ncbi:dnaJ -like subfamily C member 1 [Asbolus verrucosus]|uniref:DnaJ-like subfamily C member 1 n=1 Tax=Asbolus verrucosus TaxID=1661398 RepID=A0A482VN40_ASBVE|nr:dnaJ -like subfamily C member 1 [Asbolus verrucosus]
MVLVRVILFAFCVNAAAAWDSEQLEVFDVVDEVKENFYTLLNISQSATNQEIKSAFRGLSLKLHPDKNPNVDTSVQFRNLVSVYEVLRSSTKRKYYDEVLVNGLPNWRSAVYYYRYVRKMGMVEVCIILFIFITIGQYLVNWASYLERKYTIEQNKKNKRKKSEKFSEPAVILQKPSIIDTLPIQIPRLLWYIVVSLPKTLGLIKTVVAQQIEEATKPPPPEEPEEVPVRVKTVRKRNKGFVLPEGPNFETTFHGSSDNSNSSVPPPVSSGGLWTDDDLAELIKLVKKYPGGTSGRWEIIAEAMGRSVPEVTYMANKMKENCYKLPNEQEEEQVQVKVKQKTKKDVDGGDDSVKKWSQTQQKALEEALAKYPKGCAERWDKIADCVPHKTKEECMMRFRYLAETVKKQKESSEQPPPD